MKAPKLTVLLIFTILLASSCRKEADIIPDPNNIAANPYSTFFEQFETIWNGINSNYVFWKIDTVDWDARYERMKDKFLALDQQDTVTDLELYNLYAELCHGLIDHHMRLTIWNLSNGTTKIQYRPSDDDVRNRPYYHDRVNFDLYYNALLNLQSAGRVSSLQRKNYQSHDVIGCVLDGKYAYLHANNYRITASEGSASSDPECAIQWQIVQDYMAACQNPSIKGIILDNRGNTGGYIHDLRYVVSPFFSSDKIVAYTYTKEGLGRLDYSVPIPFIIHPADQCRSDIPIVVLTDIWSVSMGEMSTICLKSLPKTVVIGERTYGGQGPLNGQFYQQMDGTFGNSASGPHYVYTSSHLIDYENYGVLEGKGVAPDIEVLYDKTQMYAGVDVQLNKALDYLNAL